MRTGAAYVRVSTEDQVEFSPDSQIKKIREYAADHDILLPDDFIFVDEGVSGRSAEKRAAFMKMIGAAKAAPRPFDIILLWKYSRFARSRQDSILYKSMLRKEYGVDVISITEQLSDDPTAILIEALLEAMDEYYSVNLAQEVKRGMNEKFSRGGVVSAPPFGYKMGKEHFAADEQAAPFVRMIFEDFLNGSPCRQIAMKLNQMGVCSNRGNPFENRTVEYILSNPVYIGKLRRSPNGPDRLDRFHRGGGVVTIQGGHEPIVSDEMFQAAQARLADIRKIYPKNARTSSAAFMLRGLARCGHCGGTLIQSAQGRSLQCHKYARGQCDTSHSITLDKLNQAVLLQLETDLGKDELNDGLDDELDLEVPQAGEMAAAGIAQALRDKEAKRLERVSAAYEAGVDTLEEYTVKKNKIMDNLNALQMRSDAPARRKELTAAAFKRRLKEMIPKLNSTEISEAGKNEFLRSFVSKIVFIRPDESIQIYYYI